MTTAQFTASEIASVLQKLRDNKPLVHNLTNQVVMNVSANALLAIGASPIMSHAPEELEELGMAVSSTVINIGTLDNVTVASKLTAARIARDSHKPWALDPVGAGATQFRLDVTNRLLDLRPAVIRCNASEAIAIALHQRGGSGVDSNNSSDEVLPVLHQAARNLQTVFAVTGRHDYVTDGQRLAKLSNGHPMMAAVTGTGCQSTAITGAFLAIEQDPWLAAVASLAVFGIAGQLAAEESDGPGSLQLKMLDRLYTLTAEDIEQHLVIECHNLSE
ncbi:hydroxyethylthiazole kinase [Endozoicomonadaceae bacterium StTr2]